MSEHRGVVLDDTGVAISGAAVELYDIDTTTPVRASTTSDASGLWSISHSTRGRFDKKITNESDVVWLRARDRVQFSVIQVEESAANQEALVVTRTEDVASVEVATFEGDRATPADGDLAYISLKMSDSAGNQDEQARIEWSASTVANGATQDGDLAFSVLRNGSLVKVLVLDGSETPNIIIRDSNLVFEGSSTQTGVLGSDGTNMLISASGTADLVFSTGGTEAARIAGTTVFINESANANMTVGLTINQGASDDDILSFKSSDTAHGLTGQAETDTYFSARKFSALSGGLDLRSFAEDPTGIQPATRIISYGGQADTVKTTSARALVEIEASEHDGSNSLTNITADGNVLAVRARVGGAAVTRFLVDEDGDLFAVNATVTALDDEDDVGLIRAFERSRTGKGIVLDEWDEFVTANEGDLVRVGVLGAPSDEGGMWNVTQHIRLLNGAIWQQAKRIMALEQKITALPEG